MGEVTNVVLFDKETDGVASVRYANAVSANECVKVCYNRPSSSHRPNAREIMDLQNKAYNVTNTVPLESKVMNGRHYSGMVIEAYIADGNEKFKKSSEKKAAAIQEGEEGEEEGKRLDQFGTWLEEEAGAAKE